MENETKWKEVFQKYRAGDLIKATVIYSTENMISWNIGQGEILGFTDVTGIYDLDEKGNKYGKIPAIGEKRFGIIVDITPHKNQIRISIKHSHALFYLKCEEFKKKYTPGLVTNAFVLSHEKNQIFCSIEGTKATLFAEPMLNGEPLPFYLPYGTKVECVITSIQTSFFKQEIFVQVQLVKIIESLF